MLDLDIILRVTHVVSVTDHCDSALLYCFKCLSAFFLVDFALVFDANHICLLQIFFQALVEFNSLSGKIRQVRVPVCLLNLLLQSLLFFHQFAHSVLNHLFLNGVREFGLPQFTFT